MKLKYYLRGLGSGIIIATAILAITFAITNRDANIINKARELGMIFADEKTDNDDANKSTQPSGESDSSTTESKETEDDKTTENDESNITSDTEKDSTEETTEEPTTEEPTTETPTTEEPTTEEATKGEAVTFTVTRGMTSESVARILYKNGVIDDIERFNDYLKANGYATKIKIGTFTVHKGDSYETLAKIVTRG